jgi:hypothetical protein
MHKKGKRMSTLSMEKLEEQAKASKFLRNIFILAVLPFVALMPLLAMFADIPQSHRVLVLSTPVLGIVAALAGAVFMEVHCRASLKKMETAPKEAEMEKFEGVQVSAEGAGQSRRGVSLLEMMLFLGLMGAVMVGGLLMFHNVQEAGVYEDMQYSETHFNFENVRSVDAMMESLYDWEGAAVYVSRKTEGRDLVCTKDALGQMALFMEFTDEGRKGVRKLSVPNEQSFVVNEFCGKAFERLNG